MEDTNPNTGKIAAFFQKAKARAQEILNDPERIEGLIKNTKEKLLKLRSENKELDGFLNRLSTGIRMIKAHRNKTYTEMPWKSIVMVTAGIVYFIMPLDLIPDFIPVLGLLDDASVMMWIFSSLRKDIEAFEIWEQNTFTKG